MSIRTKNILRSLFLLVLIFPIITLFQAVGKMDEGSLQKALDAVNLYQLSIWLSWVVLVLGAIFFKWTRNKNFFFFFTYAFLFIAFLFLGYLNQDLVTKYELPNKFEDGYSVGILLALQHIITSIVLTAFLQAAVWWFTRRWHRE